MKTMLFSVLFLTLIAGATFAGDKVKSGQGKIYNDAGQPKAKYDASSDFILTWPIPCDGCTSTRWNWIEAKHCYVNADGDELTCIAIAWDADGNPFAWTWVVWGKSDTPPFEWKQKGTGVMY